MQLFFAFKVNLCPCSASASVLWNSHYERVGIAISKTYTRKMKANKAFGLERERDGLDHSATSEELKPSEYSHLCAKRKIMF